MEVIRFNVGNKFSSRFLRNIHRLNQTYPTRRIDELYGSIRGILPTARSKDRIPEMSWEDLEEYVREAKRYGIELNYTVNASCTGPLQDFRLDRQHVRKLLDIGVSRFTVSNDLIASLLAKEGDVMLKVSTIARVRSVREISQWLDYPVYAVTLDHSAMKNWRQVGKLNRYCESKGIYLEVLANEFCQFGCLRRNLCYNLSSHDSQRGPYGYYPFGRCWRAKRDPAEWIRAPFLLPQELGLYSSITGVTHFKITGRTAPENVVLRITRAYMRGKYTGNLLGLWPTIAHLAGSKDLKQDIYLKTTVIPDFTVRWKLDPPCEMRDCAECRYCDQIARRALR